MYPQTYAIHVRDVIRKVERDYKLTTQNNTVEYLLKGLEPGGRYSVSVRLRNMSKEASFTLSTGALTARTGYTFTTIGYFLINNLLLQP